MGMQNVDYANIGLGKNLKQVWSLQDQQSRRGYTGTKAKLQ
jgi:hypothetical protein